MKNFRYLLHVSLVCQATGLGIETADSLRINEQSAHSECFISGSLEIILRTFGYVSLTQYLRILRYSATHPTANLKSL